jgi:hypothetical protein
MQLQEVSMESNSITSNSRAHGYNAENKPISFMAEPHKPAHASVRRLHKHFNEAAESFEGSELHHKKF